MKSAIEVIAKVQAAVERWGRIALTPFLLIGH
jgi:hypothetical protein